MHMVQNGSERFRTVQDGRTNGRTDGREGRMGGRGTVDERTGKRADGWTSERPDKRVAVVRTKGRLYGEYTNDSHGPQSNQYANTQADGGVWMDDQKYRGQNYTTRMRGRANGQTDGGALGTDRECSGG